MYYVFYRFKTGEQCLIIFDSYRRQQRFIKTNAELWSNYQAGLMAYNKATYLSGERTNLVTINE